MAKSENKTFRGKTPARNVIQQGRTLGHIKRCRAGIDHRKPSARNYQRRYCGCSDEHRMPGLRQGKRHNISAKKHLELSRKRPALYALPNRKISAQQFSFEKPANARIINVRPL